MTDTQTSVPIPITTRGIGIHAQNFYNFSKEIFGKHLSCSVHQIYRVALIQLDVRIQCCQQELIYRNDAETDVYYPLPYFREFNDYTVMPKNYAIIARAISSVGNFMLNDVAYQPYVPSMTAGKPNMFDASEAAGADKEKVLINPYLVTLQSLRTVASALADPATPLSERRRFIGRNAIPGARFADDLLTNAEQIMPEDYDFQAATSDILDFVSLLKMYDAREALARMVDVIHFQNVGHISILSSVHHPTPADFSLAEDKLSYSGVSTVRSFVRSSEQDQFDGCVNLMSECPAFVERQNKGRWSMRSKYLSCSSYQTSWVSASAIDCLFPNA